MKTGLLLLLCCFILLSATAQKRKKANPFPYSYTIGDEQDEDRKYAINKIFSVSAIAIDNDSLLIEVNCGDTSVGGQAYVKETDRQARFLFFGDGKFTYKTTRSEQNAEISITLEADYYLPVDIAIEEADVPVQFMISAEKSTILNDPDSGGIIIYSKHELSPDEIDELVRCYITKKEHCYDPDEVRISIIL